MKKIFLLILLFSMTGCKTSSQCADTAVLRTVENDPEIEYPTSLEPSEQHCISPLIDSEDGSELILMRFSNGLGDYQVQHGNYGLQSGELLRIDCRTGEIVGIVRQ